MALNVAVPLSGIGELFEGCGLLSPISFGFRENIQFRISPDFSTDETSSIESKDKDKKVRHFFIKRNIFSGVKY